MIIRAAYPTTPKPTHLYEPKPRLEGLVPFWQKRVTSKSWGAWLCTQTKQTLQQALLPSAWLCHWLCHGCIGLVSGQVVLSLTSTAMVQDHIGSLQQVFNFFAFRPLTTASVGFWPDGTSAPLCGTSPGCKQASTSTLNTRRKVWQF